MDPFLLGKQVRWTRNNSHTENSGKVIGFCPAGTSLFGMASDRHYPPVKGADISQVHDRYIVKISHPSGDFIKPVNVVYLNRVVEYQRIMGKQT